MSSPMGIDEIPPTEVLDGYRDEAVPDYYSRRLNKDQKEALVE